MVKRGKKADTAEGIDDIEEKLDDASYGLAALKTLIDAVEGKLDVPDNFKADVSALLTKIYFDVLMGSLTDDSDLMGSVLSRSRAIFDNIHVHLGMVVADKTSLTANETTIVAALRKKYEVFIIDDDDVDAGNFDLEICELVIVSTSVTDMTKINKLTTVPVPVFTRNAEAALTILRIGDDSGGSGVSWGENATETAINIVDNTHEITTDHSVGSLTVYDPAGRMQWIRATDKVAGAHELAEIDGDNTKSTIIVLPYDVDDEDGNPAPALRVFIGLREFDNFNTNAQNLMFNALDWAIHQWLFSVKVQGLSRINTIINMLGRNDFTTAENLYDYLVTGTTGVAPFEVITEQESRSVMERLEWIKNGIRRGTGTILPANKSLYDFLLAIPSQAFPFTNPGAALDVTNIRTSAYTLLTNGSYGLSALKTLIDAIEAKLDHETYGLESIRAITDAILADTVAIEGKLDVPANFMADVSALALEATLGTHDTDIKTSLATIAGYIDTEIATIIADIGTVDTNVDTLITRVPAEVTQRAKSTFKVSRIYHIVGTEANKNRITVTSVAGDKQIRGGVVWFTIDFIPAGVTIDYVHITVFAQVVENTNAAANKINALQYIQVQERVSGAWTNCTRIYDDAFPIPGSTRDIGRMLGENVDCKSEVDGNDDYYLQWTNARVDLDSMYFDDIFFIVEIGYH